MRRVICVLSLAVLLAGCGASASTTSRSGATPHGFVSIEDAAYKHAVCMRRHGVPNYPNPQPVTNGGEQGIRQDLPPGMTGSPAFVAADKDCAGILPMPQNPDSAQNAQARHERELGLLAFADCMRSHGVSNFPDPTAQGQITDETLAAAGINIHLPYVIHAAVTCIPASHGVVSKAVIAHSESQSG